jgi:hypothetical protein
MVLFTVLTLELPPFPSEDCAACTSPPLGALPEGVTCWALGSEEGSDEPCWAKVPTESKAMPVARMTKGISRTRNGRGFMLQFPDSDLGVFAP